MLNQGSWLGTGPPISELVFGVSDRRVGMKRIALVMPVFRNCEVVEKHLELLSAQSSNEFDVILVYSPGDRAAAAPGGIGCVHLFRNGDYGSAGGFYAGEKFALQEGYEKIILADQDCFPVSKDLVSGLDKATQEAEVAFPQIAGTDGAAAPRNLLPQYGCLRSSALRKSGLTFAPFYFGGEDLELLSRLAKNCKTARVDSMAAHPPSRSIFLVPEQKIFYYIRGKLLGRYLNGPLAKAYLANLYFLHEAAFLFFIDSNRSKALLDAVLSSARMDFFKGREYRNSDAAEESAGPATIKIRAVNAWIPKIGPGEDRSIGVGTIIREAAESVPKSMAAFGKSAVFEERVGFHGALVVLSARKSYLESQGKIYLISDNRMYWVAPLIALFLFAILPIEALASAAFTLLGLLQKKRKGVRSEGYGI